MRFLSSTIALAFAGMLSGFTAGCDSQSPKSPVQRFDHGTEKSAKVPGTRLHKLPMVQKTISAEHGKMRVDSTMV